MKRNAFAVGLGLLVLTGCKREPSGQWSGAFRIGDDDVSVELTLERSNGLWQGRVTVAVKDEGESVFPFRSISVEEGDIVIFTKGEDEDGTGDGLKFMLRWQGRELRGKVTETYVYPDRIREGMDSAEITFKRK